MSKILEFQAANGLTADGILGKASFAKMKELWKVTDEQLAHILGQCHHESAGFKADSENLNYSAQGLAGTFPNRYAVDPKAKVKVPNALALKLSRKPEAIANNVYSSRMGNGDEKSGDGWKFRGRGALQLTGKDNYRAFTTFIKEDCIANPDLVKNKYFFESALFFFNKNGLLPLATTVTTDSITKISKRVNGGTHGLEDRIVQTNKFYKQIKG
jgi:putative chitinase